MIAPKQRFTLEELTHKLRGADVCNGYGKTVAKDCKQLGITDKTCFRWRKKPRRAALQPPISDQDPVNEAPLSITTVI